MTEKVLIVGGGPAGSAAAITIARHGVGVRLFEAAAVRGHKLSETLYPDAEASLEALGLRPPDRKPLTASYVGQNGGAKLKLSLDGGIGIVDRNDLDRSLRDAAVDAGAELVAARVDRVESSREGVTLYAEGECHQGAYLIDASGKNPITAASSGVRNSQTSLDNRFNAFSHFERAAGFEIGCATVAALEDGFAYVLPVRADRICVGVVSYGEIGAADVERTYADLLGGSGYLSALTKDAHRALPVIPAKNLETANLPLADDRTLRVGDALGFADPFLWDGLSFALQTGQVAGQLCADAVVAGKRDLRPFAERVKGIGASVRRRTEACYEDVAAKFNPAMAVDPHVSPLLLACLFSVMGGARSGGLARLRGQLSAGRHAR